MVNWTNEQIQQMSEVLPSDIARAFALVAEASPPLAEMLEAEEQEQPE